MLIEGKNLTFSYQKRKDKVLKGIDFKINKGELIFFLGKSGSGKTTLLKCLMGLIHGYRGRLDYPNGPIQKGFVAQNYHLFPHMSVLENCVHPQVHIGKRAKKEAEVIAGQYLAALGIEELGDQFPKTLSGGQQQRVAIARALCMDAELLFLDEPTSALDPATTEQFKDLTNELISKGITLVISTHDMNFVKSIKGKIYLMAGGKMIATHDETQGELSPQSPIYQYINGESYEA